jgi:succinate dehydrogenase flavin-adding protein (antitoxin of CptAB toxin-antitoxin module)
LISFCTGKTLDNNERYISAETEQFKRETEEEFRELFRGPDSELWAMMLLKSFLTEAHCDQLQYILEDIGYDFNFEWIR